MHFIDCPSEAHACPSIGWSVTSLPLQNAKQLFPNLCPSSSWKIPVCPSFHPPPFWSMTLFVNCPIFSYTQCLPFLLGLFDLGKVDIGRRRTKITNIVILVNKKNLRRKNKSVNVNKRKKNGKSFFFLSWWNLFANLTVRERQATTTVQPVGGCSYIRELKVEIINWW